MAKKKKQEDTEDIDEDAPVIVAEGEWMPRTEIGKRVLMGELTDINTILDNGYPIMEKEIVDILVPNLESDLLQIGQAKGKFGGGKRRVFRQTQKKTREGNKPRFATLAVIGNRNGLVGLGYGKSKETVPAREKALRNAKLNIFKIRRGSWRGIYPKPHTLPFIVEGKCGSVKIKLIPAPKGTGLKVDKEIAKILTLAGVDDIWSELQGQSRTKMNLIKATEDALRSLMETKVQEHHYERLNIVDGPVREGAQ